MSTTAAPVSAMEQLETAILADVVTRFANLRESTSRFSLLVKFEGLPAWQAIGNLASRNMIRKSDFNQPTDEEEYLPTASAFEFCGNLEMRRKAKTATTVVLHTLKQMFKGERKKDGFTFEDFQRHVKDLYPNKTFDASELKLGLYLAKDFNVLSVFGSDVKEVGQFRIAETAIGMANPEIEWDRVMSVLVPRQRSTEKACRLCRVNNGRKSSGSGAADRAMCFSCGLPEEYLSGQSVCRKFGLRLMGISMPTSPMQRGVIPALTLSPSLGQ